MIMGWCVGSADSVDSVISGSCCLDVSDSWACTGGSTFSFWSSPSGILVKEFIFDISFLFNRHVWISFLGKTASSPFLNWFFTFSFTSLVFLVLHPKWMYHRVDQVVAFRKLYSEDLQYSFPTISASSDVETFVKTSPYPQFSNSSKYCECSIFRKLQRASS